ARQALAYGWVGGRGASNGNVLLSDHSDACRMPSARQAGTMVTAWSVAGEPCVERRPQNLSQALLGICVPAPQAIPLRSARDRGVRKGDELGSASRLRGRRHL